MNKIFSLFSNFFSFLSKKTEKEIKILDIENSEDHKKIQHNNLRIKIKNEVSLLIDKLSETKNTQEREKIMHRIRVLLGE